MNDPVIFWVCMVLALVGGVGAGRAWFYCRRCWRCESLYATICGSCAEAFVKQAKADAIQELWKAGRLDVDLRTLARYTQESSGTPPDGSKGASKRGPL